MPLMLQYQEIRPRVNMVTGGPGAGPGGGGRRGPGAPGGQGGAPGAPAPGQGTAAAPRTPGSAAPAAGEHAEAPAGQRPNPHEVRRRIESMPPPTPSNVTLYLSDFKKVDGIMLPHRLTQAVDGKTVEEWTIEKARVNPSVKADLFEKK
jgi:hypothetical protein